jgi:hypothetical protein
LTALVSYLEANKETNALKLFNEYANAAGALQHSADIGVTLHVLTGLREGHTNEALQLLEFRLDSDIISFAANFKELPGAEQEWLGLHALSEARGYRTKYPPKHADENLEASMAQAFQLLDKKSNK